MQTGHFSRVPELEWKAAERLDCLAESQPARYSRDETSHWCCPPGDAYASHLGLTYRLRSSAEFQPLEIQNLKFLQDYWAHEVPPNPEHEALALAHIQAHPGIKLHDVLATYPQLAVDVIWVLLSTRRVFTDLSATLLMRHEQVALYAEERQVPRRDTLGESPILHPSLLHAPLAWDGRLWWMERFEEEEVQLRPEIGEPLVLTLAEFERLKEEGALWMVGAATPSPMTETVRQILLHASPRAHRVANARMIQMLVYARGECIAKTGRKKSMRLALISDIHGNHVALGAVLTAISTQNITQVNGRVSQHCGQAPLFTFRLLPRGILVLKSVKEV